MPLTEETRAAAQRLVRRYPVARSALLPLLHLVQSDEGYVSEDGIAFCAQALNLTKAEVGAVATFYTMFKREPVGDYLLSVCTNPTCKIAGADKIYAHYKDQLGGHHDEATSTSVEHAECLGICDAAPVVQVNYEMYGPLSLDEADDLLKKCRAGDPPASNWSKDVPGTFREVERELSGADDRYNDHVIAASRHLIEDYENPPAYKSGETDLPVTMPGADPRGQGGEIYRERAGLDNGAPVAAPAPAAVATAEPEMPAPAAAPEMPTADEAPQATSTEQPEAVVEAAPDAGQPATAQDEPADGSADASGDDEEA